MSASAGINASIVGAPALRFYNDSTFIRAENASTGTVQYFIKSDVCFWSDAATAFTLECSSSRGQYLFADVVLPVAASVKALLETFQAWVEETDADRESGPFVSDETTTVLEVKTHYNGEWAYIENYVWSSATSLYDGAYNGVTMSVTTAQTSRALRATRKYASIIHNKLTYALVSSRLINSTSVRNTVTRAGVYDEDSDVLYAQLARIGNGLCFQWKSGEGLSLVRRSNYSGTQVTEVVLQADWNLDKLDGTGASAKTVDPTVDTTYVFEWSSLGGMVVRAGALLDGSVTWCHKFTGVRFGCASVPIRWDIQHIDTTLATTENDAASMTQGAASVFVQGRYDGPTVSRGYSGAMVQTLTAGSSPVTVLTLRPLNKFIHGQLWIRRLSFANLDQGVAKWSMRMNSYGTTNGTAIGVPGVGTAAAYSENAVASLAGFVVASGFVQPGVSTFDVDANIFGRYNGLADIAFVVLEYWRGACTVATCLEWIEGEM